VLEGGPCGLVHRFAKLSPLSLCVLAAGPGRSLLLPAVAAGCMPSIPGGLKRRRTEDAGLGLRASLLGVVDDDMAGH